MKTLEIADEGKSKLVAYRTETDDDIARLFLTINETSAFPVDVLSDLELIIENAGYTNIGLLNVLQVDSACRGKGLGKQLVNAYCERISPRTDIDLIFARIEAPQETGLDLEKFYEGFGFQTAFYAAGEALMVNKGAADMIAEALVGLRSQRTKHYLYCEPEDPSLEP